MAHKSGWREGPIVSSSQESPFKVLWQSRYPFEYWSNRLEKINPYNQADRLEALYSLVQISDIYLHIFVAYAQNPDMPWFFLKENTRRWHIDDVLGQLRTDGMITVGGLVDDGEGTVTVDTRDGFDLHEMDAVAAGILGCPYTVDEETKSVDFEESPDLHRGVANAILNFSDDNRALLNDFKHGFRVLPVTPDDIESMLQSSFRLDQEDQEEFEAKLEELREQHERDAWAFSFVRIHADETDYGYDFQLDLYHVDAWTCYKFAELTLDALYNLIRPGPGEKLEDSLSEVPIEMLEGNDSFIDHIFGFGLPIRDDPETVVPREEFRS